MENFETSLSNAKIREGKIKNLLKLNKIYQTSFNFKK